MVRCNMFPIRPAFLRGTVRVRGSEGGGAGVVSGCE